jgi:hypothetical protein
MEEIPLEERKKANFDHPDALDWELLHEHLQAMAAGRGFDEPIYSFADYARTAETRRIEPSEFIVVEGLFVLYWPELRHMLDTKVYVETAAEVCFSRRLRRDVQERGRTESSVRDQYERTVRPSGRVVRLSDEKVRGSRGQRRRAASQIDRRSRPSPRHRPRRKSVTQAHGLRHSHSAGAKYPVRQWAVIFGRPFGGSSFTSTR